MRVYLPLGWAQLAQQQERGSVAGPLRACAVDPRWRADSPEVDEEEWEYEAAQQAADSLPSGHGLVLAVDVAGPSAEFADGWVDVSGPVSRRDVAALLDRELAWFGLQELAGLLAERAG